MALVQKYYSSLEPHEDERQNVWPPVAKRATYIDGYIREDILSIHALRTIIEYLHQGIRIQRGFLFHRSEIDARDAPIGPGAHLVPHVFMVSVDTSKIRAVRNQYQAFSDFTIRSDSIMYYMRKRGANWEIKVNERARLF